MPARRPAPPRLPLLLILGLTACGSSASGTSAETRPAERTPTARRTSPSPSQTPATRPASEPTEGTGSSPADEDSEAVRADPRFRCVMPALPIPRPRACSRGEAYPACKWKLPHATHSEHSWRRWRNTIPAHQYARPALVALLVTTAREMHRLAPEQPFVIGDLDAPGPRHETHDHGVDADLYLPGALMVENAGGGRYEDNYRGKSPEQVEILRARALLLAQILATCSEGRLRIYYNDEVVRRRFLRWFERRGYRSPFRAPMLHHNHLHDFHFHLSVPRDLPLLPTEPYSEPPPVEPIEAPPTEEEVAASNALSSRSAAGEPTPSEPTGTERTSGEQPTTATGAGPAHTAPELRP